MGCDASISNDPSRAVASVGSALKAPSAAADCVGEACWGASASSSSVGRVREEAGRPTCEHRQCFADLQCFRAVWCGTDNGNQCKRRSAGKLRHNTVWSQCADKLPCLFFVQHEGEGDSEMHETNLLCNICEGEGYFYARDGKGSVVDRQGARFVSK